MKIRKIAVVYMDDHSREHRLTMRAVRKALAGRNAKFIYRESIRSELEYGLIVVVGGDGTFLRASHYANRGQLILGVNSDPADKEGFFACCTRRTFAKKLESVLAGKARTVAMARLESFLGGKKLPPCLNEIYIGDPKPYRMSYYDVKIGSYKECHRTSGLLVAAPAGTYAWALSAGATRLPIGSRKFEVIAREPYIRRLNRQKIRKRILGPRQEVEVFSRLKRGIVVVDSISREYSFNWGRKIRIRLSAKLLNVVR
jgi:NAD+ kinase